MLLLLFFANLAVAVDLALGVSVDVTVAVAGVRIVFLLLLWLLLVLPAIFLILWYNLVGSFFHHFSKLPVIGIFSSSLIEILSPEKH